MYTEISSGGQEQKMPGGLRIYHVHPRLAGAVDGWSGLDEPDGRSWLLDHLKNDLAFNAVWFSPLSVTSDVIMKREGRNVSHSLYASRDHFRLDPEFSAPGGNDDAHLRHFTAQAEKEGVVVMADLVLNHVARDHPLVLEENRKIAQMKSGNDRHAFLFDRDRNGDLIFPGTEEEIWDDVAKIDYDSPAAVDFFIKGKDGKNGYWKDVIDWYLDRGFTGFRCDVAYMVPPPVWSELIQYAHDKKPGVVFMAETLGDQGKADALSRAKITINAQQRKAFDFSMLGTYWWNFKDRWMITENERMQKIAVYGGAGSPDTHDTHDTIAGHAIKHFSGMAQPRKDRVVSDICLRDFAVAALICNSVYMQMGYEYCREKISVFRESGLSAYWSALQNDRGNQDHPLNLSRRIKIINEFKEKLGKADALVRIDHIAACGSDNRLLKIDCALVCDKTGKENGRLIVYLNERPEDGPVDIARTALIDKETGQKMERLVLGDGDAQNAHIQTIHEVAAYYTPLSSGIRPPPSSKQSPII